MAKAYLKTLAAPVDDTENVIDLDSYRAWRTDVHLKTVYYISQDGHWAGLLGSFRCLRWVTIASKEALLEQKIARQADLVILDPNLDWTDPIQCIADFAGRGIPVVLLCQEKHRRKQSTLIKKAYAVGLFDVIFAPFQRRELLESLQIILRLHSGASSSVNPQDDLVC